MNQKGFWNDAENAQRVLHQVKALESQYERWERIDSEIEELDILFELSKEDEDISLRDEIRKKLLNLREMCDELEFNMMLGEEDDRLNALLTIHPGAGGTESQDWAAMLLRMYLKWIEKRSFEYNVLDFQPGDEAGLKRVTVEVRGDYVYGYLKAEAGIHRLVRISPFDANRRRHTSFASVFVYPEVKQNAPIELDQKDLKIETFRASGAGGQHVNKTDSAIRITHIPTGIVVQCQSERSQHKNKANAMKVLLSRLYQRRKEEERAEREKIEKNKKDISWGNQIRSYIFHPYNLVKDHRTGVEKTNVQSVMDGEIDDFIKAFLLKR